MNKVIAICQSGGEFESVADGVLSYKGGDAHAMEIDDRMKFKHLKLEVAEIFIVILVQCASNISFQETERPL